MRILVLGGHGNFGARICRALAATPEIEVLAASRHPAQAPADFASLPIKSVFFDARAANPAARLREHAPGIVIHCIGPFQGQGYEIAMAAAEAGAHYIDLADGRDFVSGFAEAVDAVARAHRVLTISGASTLPALSSAVVDHFLPSFQKLRAVDIVIAPAQRAPRGPATLAGVLSYVGRPFAGWSGGRQTALIGWQDVRRVPLGPLGSRWSAPCDVPDLALFPKRYEGIERVTFRAALEVGIQHFFIAAAAALRRIGVPLPLERLSPALETLATGFNPLGSKTGGMIVRLTGRRADGREGHLTWHIEAPDNSGPEIPCMAAILMAEKLAGAREPSRGAAACMGFLTLAEFEPQFAKWGMHTGFTEAWI